MSAGKAGDWEWEGPEQEERKHTWLHKKGKMARTEKYINENKQNVNTKLTGGIYLRSKKAKEATESRTV